MNIANCESVKIVSFSGIDGAGKTTQIESLIHWLQSAGLSVDLLTFWDDVVVLSRFREGMSRRVFKGDKGIGSPEKPLNRRDKNVTSRYMTASRFFLYFLDALSLWRKVYLARKRDVDVVVFDRYIYDELANLPLLSNCSLVRDYTPMERFQKLPPVYQAFLIVQVICGIAPPGQLSSKLISRAIDPIVRSLICRMFFDTKKAWRKNADGYQKTLRRRETNTLTFALRPRRRRHSKMPPNLGGLPLSTWVRERLRGAARKELEDAGLPVPFLQRTLEPQRRKPSKEGFGNTKKVRLLRKPL